MASATAAADSVLKGVKGDPTTFLFWCPGCEHCHTIDTKRWKWDGDVVRPTVSPSLLIHSHGPGDPVCHSFVRGGEIQFLGDCTHKLAGKTVRLEPF